MSKLLIVFSSPLADIYTEWPFTQSNAWPEGVHAQKHTKDAWEHSGC